MFTANSRQHGYGNYDFYISYLTPQGWSEAINLGGKVNSDQWDSQPCLSPDKRDLYFASRRLGGFGGRDIYVSHLQPNGDGVNRKIWGQESIHQVMKNVLLFMQIIRHYILHQMDYRAMVAMIFLCKKRTRWRWSKPMNLGYPINTINDEGTLFIAADGKTAYYASDRSDSKGGHDIYSFELPENIRPYKTLWVKGKVLDKKTTKGTSSSVELIDLATKQTITKVQTDETGNYFITLACWKRLCF